MVREIQLVLLGIMENRNPYTVRSIKRLFTPTTTTHTHVHAHTLMHASECSFDQN